MDSISPPRWLAVVISLPSHRGTSRMRVWRALKGMGAAVLRDGVYFLPHGKSVAHALREQAETVIRSGGMAHVLAFNGMDQPQDEYFRKLFDRTAEYARLIETIQKLGKSLTPRRVKAMARQLKKMRREFESVVATDYFPGPAKEQAHQILSQLEAVVTGLLSPGEPQPKVGEIRRLDKADYQNRVWATRAHPWVDRLASAWLIRRFIDQRARFVWLKDLKDCPPDAHGFDFDNAAFTHVGARVTFEVLLASFSLAEDTALARLGSLVHSLDVGGVPVAEAPGIEMVLNGARQQHTDDDKLFKEACKVFDFLYASYTEK